MDFLPTPEFEGLIAGIARELTDRDLPFMVIGGQALLLHGEPRLTQDVDITLEADPGGLPAVLEVCRALGLQPLPEEPTTFVRRTFVLPAAEIRSGVRVDFIFSTTPYEQQAINMLPAFGDELDMEWLRPRLEREDSYDAFLALRELVGSSATITDRTLRALLDRLRRKRKPQ